MPPTGDANAKKLGATLAGSGGIFDFPNVSTDAGTLEDAVSAMIDGRGNIDDVADAIATLLRCIKTMDAH
jgi:hypothetical protein